MPLKSRQKAAKRQDPGQGPKAAGKRKPKAPKSPGGHPLWKKGETGNPRGRPKKLRVKQYSIGKSIEAGSRAFTSEAVSTLVAVMRDGRDPDTRRKAAQALLDRGWGRPTERTEVTLEEDLIEILRAVGEICGPELYEKVLRRITGGKSPASISVDAGIEGAAASAQGPARAVGALDSPDNPEVQRPAAPGAAT